MDKSALVSLIEVFAGWALVELIIVGVREVRRDSADRVKQERTVKGYTRILADEERRSGKPEIYYSHRIGARSSPE